MPMLTLKMRNAKPLNTKQHGWVDYMFTLVMVLLPWVLGWDYAAWEALLMLGAACVTQVYSLCTRYANGLLRVIPMHVHLTLDVLVGLLLMVLPWLLTSDIDIRMPFLAVGVLELIVAALSQNTTDGKPLERRVTAADVR